MVNLLNELSTCNDKNPVIRNSVKIMKNVLRMLNTVCTDSGCVQSYCSDHC